MRVLGYAAIESGAQGAIVGDGLYGQFVPGPYGSSAWAILFFNHLIKLETLGGSDVDSALVAHFFERYRSGYVSAGECSVGMSGTQQLAQLGCEYFGLYKVFRA